MATLKFLRRILLRSAPNAAVSNSARRSFSPIYEWRSQYTITSETVTRGEKGGEKNGNKWFTLPPFTSTVDGAILGKEIARNRSEAKNYAVKGRGAANPAFSASTTALKWVVRCCPGLPRSFVQKLFRLRQVGFLVHGIAMRRFFHGFSIGKPSSLEASSVASLFENPIPHGFFLVTCRFDENPVTLNSLKWATNHRNPDLEG